MFNLATPKSHQNKRKTSNFPIMSALICMFIVNSANVYSQENKQSNKRQQEKEQIERITVNGGNLDAAMSAFNAGNFELAEIEFKMNAKCALRIERNKQAFVGGLQSSSINSSLQSSASIPSNSSGQGTSNTSSSAVSSGLGGTSSNQEQNTVVRPRTCDNRGYQLYMTGLSQIQLGRAEEAEKNLKTASFLNTNIYDAHYRVALMQLLRNDLKGAKGRLSDIQRVLKRCRDCESREEILVRIDFIEKALSGEIKLN